MKKVLLWCIPTFLIFFSVMFKWIFDKYVVDIFVLMFYSFTLFFFPCYYIFMIYLSRDIKIQFIKSFLYSIIFIFVNAILVCPESIQVYLGLREWKVHDIDMLPFFVMLPISIIIIGCGLIALIKARGHIKKRWPNTRGRFYCVTQGDGSIVLTI